ncbi:TRAP transporter small permease [bacterium]|nr:TRAP transporter small permease [bacterium]
MEINKQKAKDQKIPVMDNFRIFHYLDGISNYIETALNIVGVVFILILMVFTASEIIARYLFTWPIPGYVEDVELIMAALVFLGIGYTQRIGAHIRMDMVISKLKGRFYHIAEAISLLLGLFGFGIILIFSFKFTVDAYQVGDVTEYLYTPTWPSKLCVPLGIFFLCTRFMIQIIKNIAQAIVGIEIKKME